MGQTFDILDAEILVKFTVLPNWRLKGIGRKLLNFITQTTFQRGYSKLILGVSLLNIDALKFYNRCGFKVLGFVGWYTGKPDSVDYSGAVIRQVRVADIPAILKMKPSSLYTMPSEYYLARITRKQPEKCFIMEKDQEMVLFAETREIEGDQTVRLNTLMINPATGSVDFITFLASLSKKLNRELAFFIEGTWRQHVEELIRSGFEMDYFESELLLARIKGEQNT